MLAVRQLKALDKKYSVRRWTDTVYNIEFCAFFGVSDGCDDPHKYIDSAYCHGKLDTIDGVNDDFVMSDGGCTSDLFNDDIPIYLIVFMFGEEYPASLVSHEAYHGAHFVLTRANVKDEEAYAYYVQYLVKNIME